MATLNFKSNLLLSGVEHLNLIRQSKSFICLKNDSPHAAKALAQKCGHTAFWCLISTVYKQFIKLTSVGSTNLREPLEAVSER